MSFRRFWMVLMKGSAVVFSATNYQVKHMECWNLLEPCSILVPLNEHEMNDWLFICHEIFMIYFVYHCKSYILRVDEQVFCLYIIKCQASFRSLFIYFFFLPHSMSFFFANYQQEKNDSKNCTIAFASVWCHFLSQINALLGVQTFEMIIFPLLSIETQINIKPRKYPLCVIQ